jgi:hypothetical protein
MPSIKNIFWNSVESRLRAGWRLAIQIILNIGLAISLLNLATRLWGTSASESPWFNVIVAPLFMGATLLSVCFASRFLDRRRFSNLGVHLGHRDWWADFGFGLTLGTVPLSALILVATAAGWMTLEPVFTSGIPGTSFAVAVLGSLWVYVCIGVFEELARAYHVRNLLEGLDTRRLGLKGAMVGAVVGASLISVLMHSGNTAFLLFVFVSTVVNALCYLLTGRIAIATGYHIAWDFVLATVFGLGAQAAETTTAFFIIHSEGVFRVDGSEISFILMGILIGLELVGLLLILKWVSLRYGKNTLHQELAVPNLLPRQND